MKELIPSAFRGKNKSHPAGVFVRGGDAHTIVMRLDCSGEDPSHVLYHEYVHLLNELSYRRLPLWLDEGLAEFYGSARIEEGVAFFGQLSPWQVRLLRRRPPLPLDRFFEVVHSSPDYNERDRKDVFYAEAATLTHFFVIGDKGERRAALSEYARLVGGGMPEPEARRQTLGDLKRLEKAYRGYLNRPAFEAFKLEAAYPPPEHEVPLAVCGVHHDQRAARVARPLTAPPGTRIVSQTGICSAVAPRARRPMSVRERSDPSGSRETSPSTNVSAYRGNGPRPTRRWPATCVVLAALLACSPSSGPLQFASSEIWLTAPMFSGWIPQLADVSGDGKADLVVFKRGADAAPVYVGLSQGTSFAPLSSWHGPFCINQEHCDTGDVNADGKADILAFVHGNGQADGSANVWVALSDGTKFLPARVWNDGFCITEQTCAVGDINGDKRADIVAYTPITGLVWASPSTGSGFGPNGVRQQFFCIRGEVCTLGDVDGDAKSDLVLFKPTAPPGQKGNVLWAKSSGVAFGPAQLGHGYFCIDAEHCFVADFSADKKADVMLLKRQSPFESLVSLSNGTQFINPTPFTWSTSIPGSPADVGDVNGDGRADVLTYETVGGNTRYYITLTSDGTRMPSGGESEPTRGVEGVDFFNCVPERRPLYLWVTDMTANDVRSYGPIEHAYNAADQCPDEDSEPFDVNFADQHQYQIIAVDPGAIGCSGNDASVLACQRQDYFFVGREGGPRVSVFLPAEWP